MAAYLNCHECWKLWFAYGMAILAVRTRLPDAKERMDAAEAAILDHAGQHAGRKVLRQSEAEE